MIKKILVAAILGLGLMANVTLADNIGNNLGDSSTVLPKVTKEVDCNSLLNAFNNLGGTIASNDTLACAITTGRISLPMVPFFIKYFSNYLLGLVSLVALLFTVIGGFMYTASGLTDSKDKGKKYITNALMGMALAFLSWSIVNVIL